MRWNVEFWPPNPLADTAFMRPWWIPRPFWRMTWWIRAVTMLPYVGVLVWWALDRSKVSMLIGPGLLMVLGLLWAICPRLALRRFRTTLSANDFLLCLWCGYSLKGLPTEHRCPECGTPYEAGSLIEAWQHWVEKRRLPKSFNKSK